MKSWNENPIVVCPFYKGEDKQKIRCEGVKVVSGGVLHLVFEAPKDKDRHRDKVCANHIESKKCPIFKMLCDQYYSKEGGHR